MTHSELKISKKTKSVHSDPVNRHKLLGWANETLSKLKSDKDFLRTTVKKNKRGDEIANADYRMTVSKQGKCVEEEISKLETNDVATYVSEIVTSKMKRKIRHMALDSSVTRDKQKKKASNKEHSANTKTKGNGDNQYKLKAKHRLTMVSCSEEQQGDLYGHEESTEKKKKKKKKKEKYKESSYQPCSADTTISEEPLILWVPVVKERPRKKQKLTEHSKSDRVNCHHCCKCASKEVKSQKKEMDTNDETNMFDDMKCLSGTRKVKKCKMHSDLYTGSKNESVSLWKRMEDTGSYKQDKKKRSKHTCDSTLEEGEQLNKEDAPKECSKEKKKEKRYYTHSFSEQFISEKKKLKKYKLYTQKHKCDESRSASEYVCRLVVGFICESSSATDEYKAFEVHCVTGEKRKRRKRKHDYCFNDVFEETKNETHNYCETEYTSERSKQKTNKENSHDYAVEGRKRKKRSEKHNIYSESEIISEANDHSDPGPQKKKKRKKEKRNCKDNENISNSEERDKQQLYSDRNNVNTVETSFMEGRQKKKQKKAKKKICNSVDAKEGSEKDRNKKGAGICENQKTNEVMDHALLDYASTSSKYSVKRKDKTGNKRKPETGGVELVNSKKNRASSVKSKETHGNTAATIQEGVMGYEESNLSPELTQTVKSWKENNNNRDMFTGISVNTHKNTCNSRNIKQSRNIGSFGVSPISRLLDMESESRNSEHSCQTCHRCKLPPKIWPRERSESATKAISNIVIKSEPGVIIKQEKEVADNIDPHVVDKRMLGAIQDSEIELNTNYTDRTDDGVKKTENNDASIDKLGMQEHVSTGSGNGPNECLTMHMCLDGTDRELGSVGCMQGFSDEDVVNENEEIDINTPFYNIYDDKITVKEEILHLTDIHADQDNGREHVEDTSQGNFEFVGVQDMGYMDSKLELPSVTTLNDTAADVARTPSMEEVNGSNLNTVPQCVPVPLNELQSNCTSEIIPEAASVHNTTWNARETSGFCWPSVNGNEPQSSQFVDITAFTTGQVCFSHVPRW
jgi:hypothetical protein